MYANIYDKIEKVRGQIESVSYKMIEAEGDEYDELAEKLETLESKLEDLEAMVDGSDMMVDRDD